MRLIVYIIAFFNLISCDVETNPNVTTKNLVDSKSDTVIVKQKRTLNASYEVGFYSKSYAYSWLVGEVILDMRIVATEHEKDSTLHLNFYHTHPIPFTKALESIRDCMNLIDEDFDITKLSSLYFKDPIYYPDLTQEVSIEYEQKFGLKKIGYEQLNPFLLESKVTAQLNNFLEPWNKEVQYYSIEKMHLIGKESYKYHLPKADTTNLPEIIINGMGLSVRLKPRD